jgi:predicted SAM-dependent methyltransferase
MLGDFSTDNVGRFLEIGAGNSRMPGFETSDIRKGCDHQCEATKISSLGKFDHLYANMILEHLRPWEYPIALKDWYDTLNPGGVLDVIVPDLDDIIRLCGINLEEALRRLFGGSLVKGGPDDIPEQEHRFAFTGDSLKAAFLDAGFTNVTRMPSKVGILWVRGIK